MLLINKNKLNSDAKKFPGKMTGVMPRGESIYRYVPVYVCQAIYDTLF